MSIEVDSLISLGRAFHNLGAAKTKAVHAFDTSRIDYCNSLYRNKLQRVQNMCARLICNENKYCLITPLLADLHWLPVKFRIEFKIDDCFYDF